MIPRSQERMIARLTVAQRISGTSASRIHFKSSVPVKLNSIDISTHFADAHSAFNLNVI